MRILLLILSLFVFACDLSDAVAPTPSAVGGDRLAEALRALENARSAPVAAATGGDVQKSGEDEQDLLTCTPIGAFEGQAVHCTPSLEIAPHALTWSLPEEPGAPIHTGPAFDFPMPSVCDLPYRLITVRVEARDAGGVLVGSDAILLVSANTGQP